MKSSIRRTDCVECDVVLSTGVYLTFYLPRNNPTLEALVEVDRKRMNMRPRESILVDASLLTAARQEAFDAIIKHRKSMNLAAKAL